MFQLRATRLPNEAQAELEALQAEIDAAPSYAERVTAARKDWENRTHNQTFDTVRECLKELCHGYQRCCYCGDSAGHQIDHILPKSFYPQLVFTWTNMLLCCGFCNETKNNTFQVFREGDRVLVDLSAERQARTKNSEPLEEPTAGDPVLLNPREEDPMAWMYLDIRGSFLFTALTSEPEAKVRVDETIAALDLNGKKRRGYLVGARKHAYDHYRSSLKSYCNAKDGNAEEEMALQRRMIEASGHRTVWLEMIRQRAKVPELAALFERAPEALMF